MSANNPTLYRQRKAAGRCVDCAGSMLPEWLPAVRCPTCIEVIRKARAKYQRTDKGKAATKRYQQTERAKAQRSKLAKGRYLARKVAGQCQKCSRPCADDSGFCPTHRDAHRVVANASYRRRAA